MADTKSVRLRRIGPPSLPAASSGSSEPSWSEMATPVPSKDTSNSFQGYHHMPNVVDHAAHLGPPIMPNVDAHGQYDDHSRDPKMIAGFVKLVIKKGSGRMTSLILEADASEMAHSTGRLSEKKWPGVTEQNRRECFCLCDPQWDWDFFEAITQRGVWVDMSGAMKLLLLLRRLLSKSSTDL